jgi:hypothetical protein
MTLNRRDFVATVGLSLVAATASRAAAWRWPPLPSTAAATGPP